MSPSALEFRVGAFLLAALAVVAGFAAMLGHVDLGRGPVVCGDFAYVGTLQPGAPVKISGVKIGQVRSLALLRVNTTPAAAASVAALGRSEHPVVRACMSLDADTADVVSDAATWAVATQGVIGEAYVEIEPRPGQPLVSGAVVRGVDAPRLHVMALQMAALMEVTGGLLQPDSADHAPLGQAAVTLLGTVNGLLSERHQSLGRALDNMAASATDLRDVTAGLRAGIGDGAALRDLVDQTRDAVALVQRELPAVAAKSTQTLASLDALGEKANRAFDAGAVAAMLSDAKAATSHLEKLTADAQAVMKSLRQGEGTLGGLTHDPQIYDDAKELLRDLKRHPWKFLWRD